MTGDQRQRTLESICVGPFKEFWGERGSLKVRIDRGEAENGYQVNLIEKGQTETFYIGGNGQVTYMNVTRGPGKGPETPRTSHLDKVLQLIARDTGAFRPYEAGVAHLQVRPTPK